MVTLNIPTFDFSLCKIFLKILANSKIFIYEISPYFLLNSSLTFIFFIEIFQKWLENYDNISQFFFLTKHKFNMNFLAPKT